MIYQCAYHNNVVFAPASTASSWYDILQNGENFVSRIENFKDFVSTQEWIKNQNSLKLWIFKQFPTICQV